MFWEWLESVRKKPKTVREQYAFFGAAGIAVLVAAIWAVSLPGHFAGINVENSPEKEADGAFARFFGDAKANLGAVFSSAFHAASSTVASTTATGSPETPATGIVIPDLSERTIEEIQAESRRENARPVLIATTSTHIASSSEATQ